jgi:hypothetical protein
MKEIKFRAWDKKERRMCRVINFQPSDDGTNAITTLFVSSAQTVVRGNNIDFELQQFTGLKDKNGKEIYEGDLLIGADKIVEEVGWSNDLGKWMIKNQINPDDSLGYFAEDMEVIGNIWENPELLTPEIKN